MPMTGIVCLRAHEVVLLRVSAVDIHKYLIFHRYLFQCMREITNMSEI